MLKNVQGRWQGLYAKNMAACVHFGENLADGLATGLATGNDASFTCCQTR
jgi:hypothetical protein